jgi:hypothetical protein
MSVPGALDGLLVLDLTTFLSGPYCTMMLGDLGAEVIKVERPEGDEARRMPPFVEGRSQPFALWNRNKRSIALDLKAPPDAELLWQLVRRADVLVENFRPGALARAIRPGSADGWWRSLGSSICLTGCGRCPPNLISVSTKPAAGHLSACPP